MGDSVSRSAIENRKKEVEKKIKELVVIIEEICGNSTSSVQHYKDKLMQELEQLEEELKPEIRKRKREMTVVVG